MIYTLTLTMKKTEKRWIGECRELDVVAAGPDHFLVWQDLFNICKAQIAFAVENDLTDSLLRNPSPPETPQ